MNKKEKESFFNRLSDEIEKKKKRRMTKEIIIYFENGFYSSDLLPLDLNDKQKKYTYFDDIIKDVDKVIKNKKEVLK